MQETSGNALPMQEFVYVLRVTRLAMLTE